MRRKQEIIDVSPHERQSNAPLWIGAISAALLCAGLALIVIMPALALGSALADAVAESYALWLWLMRVLSIALAAALLAALTALVVALWRRVEPVEHLADVPMVRKHITAQLTEQMVAAELQARLLRAERSQYSQLTSYTYHNRATHAPIEPPALTVQAPALPSGFGIAELVQAGSTPDCWVIGIGTEQPARIELPLCGAICVAGVPRSGKSTSAATLIAQAVHHGSQVYVCDPHARANTGLLGSLEPLQPALAGTAIDDDAIVQLIAHVNGIARARLSGQHEQERVLLVIDEFTALQQRGVLAEQQTSELLQLAVEASKARVHLLLLSQDWSASALGRQSALVRRVSTHRLLHKSQPGSAALLLPGSDYERELSTLQPGLALFAGTELPALVRVPRIESAALAEIAQRAPAREPLALADVLAEQSMPALSREPSTAEQIVALLASESAALDCAAIAERLDAPLSAVQPALTRLTQAGAITRAGKPRNYAYSRAE